MLFLAFEQMKPLHETDFTFRVTIFGISSGFVILSSLLEVCIIS